MVEDDINVLEIRQIIVSLRDYRDINKLNKILSLILFILSIILFYFKKIML